MARSFLVLISVTALYKKQRSSNETYYPKVGYHEFTENNLQRECLKKLEALFERLTIFHLCKKKLL